MRLRLTVTQLRVLILVVNCVLALGVPAMAAYHYFGSLAQKGTAKDRSARATTVHPRGTFAYVDQGGGQTQSNRGQVPGVVNWLLPKAPEAAPPPPPPDPDQVKTPDVTSASPEDYQPGPLATEHNLEYVYYIVREDPSKTQVVLAKQAPGVPGMPSPGVVGSSRSTIKARTTTAASRKRAPVKGVAQPSDVIQFHVYDRHYKNEEMGLEFWIHHADSDRFVYWMPADEGKPKKTYYALKYKKPGEYLNWAPDDDELKRVLIRPPPLGEEAKAQEEADKGKARIFVRGSRDYTSKREEEYEKIHKGELTPAKAATFGSETQGGSAASPAAAPGAAPAIGPGSTNSGRPPLRGSNLPSGPRTPTSEEVKALKEGIKDIPKEAQDEVIKAMRGGVK